MGTGDWGLEIGDWGLGIGDWLELVKIIEGFDPCQILGFDKAQANVE